MKYSKFKMIVMVGIIANQSFLTNTAQLSGNPTPSPQEVDLLSLAQKIVDNPDSLKKNGDMITIQNESLLLDTLPNIAKYYYLLSDQVFEQNFPSFAEHVVSKEKPLYGFSLAELINYAQYHNLPLIELESELTEATTETTLDLSNKKLNNLDGIMTLPKIEQVTRLNLSENQLTSLPEAIFTLTQLNYLNLSYNQLTSLPTTIRALTQLHHLNLSYNQLTSLPTTIRALTQLYSLNLSKNQFKSLPEAISDFTQLYSLNLSYNELTSLPDTISAFTQLQDLDLSYNELTSLPEAIFTLTQLNYLNLSENQLKSLPTTIRALTQLHSLDLSKNQLTSLPTTIRALTQLRSLDLSKNQLTSFPKAISALTQLQVLNLSENQLKSLPEAISALTQLNYLNLSENQLTSLPEAISALTQLYSLNLSKNQLTSLPEAISALTQLSYLNLDDNPIHPSTIPLFTKTLPTAFRKAIQSYRDNNHNTLLHKAAEAGNKKAIDNLKLYDLSMDTQNLDNITPQMILNTQPTNMSPKPESVAAKFFLFSFIHRLYSAIKNLWTSPNEVNITQPPVDTPQPPQEPAAAESFLMRWLYAMIKKLKPS